MNAPANDEEDHGEVFLDETDALHVITIDDQDLPEADEELGSDGEAIGIEFSPLHSFLFILAVPERFSGL
ncbi:hypothetical protein RHGRI_016727 [Rhododendron griersonianum]|uniref:Uncharacterized protein n=1 Tax=Rhododendron griersonianum TaxID=479676 RepID=A0AAV6JV76_9ERIC|nr:hypothetical protein RHGRI_016727 [Rhododendron griersonianum]